ncbi:hypothetical protein ERO13_A10G220850v2 [Gossypium hirsutum]|uniref:Uncharacterized protein n=5 Tax=Gossypium TaxID=3633 RepID=A0ABR0NKA9_GOSAR|nr:hypothetical protein ES319_1Z103600v1 [Gossypium barbadense]KAG4181338.1 hypothetical protein ERO13_A10G220850v2 [Gossypium hirsutum]KAK5795458.1 hypothetical protein PVK06_036726 [Gossypium arboreum]TYH00387.1 hypothetical protein ES288_A10G272100v1 [Gossypium darwinii]TYI08017.1 hypothetical protein ES332_A10G267400v1 [Gossypium tomentosum]
MQNPIISKSLFLLMEIYEQEEGFMTPRRHSQATAPPPCPAAPKKKQAVHIKRKSPNNEFFHPPDLEALFTSMRQTQKAPPPLCPPAPKKKQAVYMKREPPRNGFFQPPDLEALFSIMAPKKETCVSFESACRF